MDIIFILPVDCISRIISFTSPRDACRSSVVSLLFKSAADCDTVWERFLPSDYLEIISTSTSPSSSSPLTSLTKKKDLYFHLCNNPILINNATMSFSLEKESGKKCYMVGARELSITWGDTPEYWKWISLPESRFLEVAELLYVYWFEITARMETKNLSPKTTYASYLVFKFARSKYGFRRRPVELSLFFEGTDRGVSHMALLDPPENVPRLVQDRRDGWMEIEIGGLFSDRGDDGMVLCGVFDFGGIKEGFIVQGIEFRPKKGR